MNLLLQINEDVFVLFSLAWVCANLTTIYLGNDKIEHRKPVKYYVELFTGKVQGGQSAIIDDKADLELVDDQLKLAIEDKAEGEPEDDDVAAGAARAGVDTSKSHRWGPFVFSYVARDQSKEGSAQTTQWQVTCPLHKDKDDPAGTQCKKTLGFDGDDDDDRDEAARVLRHWCVKGFSCSSRRCGNDSHLSKLQGRKLRGMRRVDDAKLEEMLSAGLAKLQEELENDPDDDGPPPLVSGSDSSDSSDTSGTSL